MLFNSTDFAVFLPVVFILYWAASPQKLKLQNLILLLASYFFYACWDWRFLFLLLFSTTLDYFTGIKIGESNNSSNRKFWLLLSITINLGLLGFFKYYNFFVDSFATFLALLGLKANTYTLRIILPVGISFYTFHGLSYILDIYNKKIKAEYQFTDYAVFVSFFPLLVAGPIERATHLLPQIKQNRSFTHTTVVDGLRQILWGLFKKIVIADNCATISNEIFNNSTQYSGSTLALGAFFFAVQIYGDFSGYSDIAIGTARLFGINLLRNFAFPYFSRDIAEFWRRWHISLSSWFRDYLYIPLGGSRGSVGESILNTFLIFIISGFWHGANWTFIFWGALHAVYFLPLLLRQKNRIYLNTIAEGKLWPSLKESWNMATTFCLTTVAWIFFRSERVSQAIDYCKRLFLGLLNKASYAESYNFLYWRSDFYLLLVIALFFAVEWIGREQQHALQKIGLKWPQPMRYALYYILIVMLFYYGGKPEQFIYFQF